MRQLVELVETIVWWITRLILWCAFLVGPILLVGIALELCGASWGTFHLDGIRITKQSDLLYWMATIGLMTAAGAVYVLRLQGGIEQKREIKYVLLSCVLASLFMGSHFEARYFRELVNEAAPINVELALVDADTGEPLDQLSVRYPDPETLPEPFFAMSSDFNSRPGGEGFGYTLKGVGVPGVTYDFTFSAASYEAKRMQVGVDTKSGVVKLKRTPDEPGNGDMEAE